MTDTITQIRKSAAENEKMAGSAATPVAGLLFGATFLGAAASGLSLLDTMFFCAVAAIFGVFAVRLMMKLLWKISEWVVAWLTPPKPQLVLVRRLIFTLSCFSRSSKVQTPPPRSCLAA